MRQDESRRLAYRILERLQSPNVSEASGLEIIRDGLRAAFREGFITDERDRNDAFNEGAAVAFGLMGMAIAIGATHDPWRYCACGASYLGSTNASMCFGCEDEQTPEWQAWAKAAGVTPRSGKKPAS